MRDLSSLVSAAALLPAAVYAADNTPAAVDLNGYESAVLFLHVGIGGITFDATNKIEFKLTHSDDGTTYDAVTADDVQGVASVGTGGIVKALVAAHAADDVTKIGYMGGRRYLKLLADFSGTHGTGTPIAATVVKGNPRFAPAP
ncbi:MAG: hypothetical protein J0H60_01515 [Rhizobiales bacterium]|nr:hypothetical protein [Hyphomicrobiales bacterium]